MAPRSVRAAAGTARDVVAPGEQRSDQLGSSVMENAAALAYGTCEYAKDPEHADLEVVRATYGAFLHLHGIVMS